MTDLALRAPAAQYSIFPGRSITFSPAWDEDGASVLFDRNSGDYWVVLPVARELVRYLSDLGTLDGSLLIDRVQETLSGAGFDDSAADTQSVLSELEQLGILAQTDA